MSTINTPMNNNFDKSRIKANVRIVGYNAQLVDIYTSFARQAAQAMKIQPSKTIYPVDTTPDILFKPKEFTISGDIDTTTTSTTNTDTRGISFVYDRWTVNKSPFVHGRHQDQFEIRTYQRDIQLFKAETKTIKSYLHYITMNLPFGVGLEYSVHDYIPLDTLIKSNDNIDSNNNK